MASSHPQNLPPTIPLVPPTLLQLPRLLSSQAMGQGFGPGSPCMELNPHVAS